MSAFIVSSETMHRVVFAIERQTELFAGLPAHTCAQLDVIGRALFEMNARAVNSRYPGEPQQVVPEYTFRPLGDEISVPKAAQFKAVACLLYQCSEGNEPDSELFKALDALCNRLACAVAHHAARAFPWDYPER